MAFDDSLRKTLEAVHQSMAANEIAHPVVIVGSRYSPFSQTVPKNLDLRWALHPAPFGAGCKTRLESSIKRFGHVSLLHAFAFRYNVKRANRFFTRAQARAQGAATSSADRDATQIVEAMLRDSETELMQSGAVDYLFWTPGAMDIRTLPPFVIGLSTSNVTLLPFFKMAPKSRFGLISDPSIFGGAGGPNQNASRIQDPYLKPVTCGL